VHKLAQSVLGYIRKHDLLRAGDRVGAAVSGGADSVGLLRILLELRQELGIVLSVVHLNHKLRGAESDADEQFVRELAATHGMEVVCESRDVKAYAAEKKLSLEAAAREVRQASFANCIRGGLDKVATAHTLDDQAETVLMRIVRGSGFRGLQGIQLRIEVQDEGEEVCGAIVRPFLSVRRSAARDYLAEIGQSWREDSSNQDDRFRRNRVRRLLMPLLEREFNPAVAERLAELAEIARGEEEFWARECGTLMSQMSTTGKPEWANFFYTPIATASNPEGTPDPGLLEKMGQPGPIIMNIGLDLQRFRNLSLGAQRRLIQSLDDFGMPLEFKHINDIIELTSDENTGDKEIRLPWGWRAVRTAQELQFLTADLRTEERIPTSYEYPLAVPGAVTVWEAGVVLDAVLVNAEQGHQSVDLVDPNLLPGGLIVRNWHAGERFWPSHTKEPKKIKELLQDRHITGDEKKRWPVVASGDEIVWVRGLGVRRDLQAKDGSGVLIQESQIA
jgi:tRNA(Ile)-lysidine synthase